MVEAPFAKGTGRYGVLVQGSQPFVGDVSNLTGGAISVTGNNSFGIAVLSPLTGNITNAAGVTITGDQSVGLKESGGVSDRFC